MPDRQDVVTLYCCSECGSPRHFGCSHPEMDGIAIREPEEFIPLARFEEEKRGREAAEAEVERLEDERTAVIAAINIYGDETLHSALDDIGFALASPDRKDGDG